MSFIQSLNNGIIGTCSKRHETTMTTSEITTNHAPGHVTELLRLISWIYLFKVGTAKLVRLNNQFFIRWHLKNKSVILLGRRGWLLERNLQNVTEEYRKNEEVLMLLVRGRKVRSWYVCHLGKLNLQKERSQKKSDSLLPRWWWLKLTRDEIF